MIHATNNTIHCLLFEASLHAIYWVEELNTATHLFNYLPSKVVSNPTPRWLEAEILTGFIG
jgi:hypothetical protein